MKVVKAYCVPLLMHLMKKILIAVACFFLCHVFCFFSLRVYGGRLLEIIQDMDSITSSHSKWLLGNWLEAAKRLAKNDDVSGIENSEL